MLPAARRPIVKISWNLLFFAVLCWKSDVRLYIFEAYLTRAVCALDMNVHAEAARLWAGVKQAWATMHMKMTLWHALPALRLIANEYLSEKVAWASWARTGFKLNCSIDRNVVLVDRRAEVFCNVPHKSDGGFQECSNVTATPTLT